MNLSVLGSMLLACAAAAGVSAVSIAMLLPLFRRVALARPNARSSHSVPTPQGAGLAVVIATVVVGVLFTSFGPAELRDIQLWGGDNWSNKPWHTSGGQGIASIQPILLGTLMLTLVGSIDDIRPISVMPRLMIQAACAALMLAAIPNELRVDHDLPLWLERAAQFAIILWFINLVNFMDGLDWMMVVEVVPMTATLLLMGCAGYLPLAQTLIAAILCGAYLGFSPFNRPPAHIFLGDAGSLPSGFLLAWLLVHLAGHGYLAATLLLPMYFMADASLTLIQRLARGERIWQAHRSHYYQLATTNGFTVQQIVGRVFLLNVLLSLLAIFSLVATSNTMQCALLIVGIGAVIWLLRHFSSAGPIEP